LELTHEELLREIAKTYTVDLSDMGYTLDSAVVIRQAKALGAVVEYHAPYQSKDYGLLCRGCDEDPNYPCGTIRAIQEQLQ
jgi:hypothetical protein